jgi:predicted dehydrogenase
MIRIGLLGCGRIARIHHVPILSRAEDPSYRSALSAFAKATRDRTRPSPDIEDGVRSMAIVLAAETAAREGYRRPVEALAS